MAQLPAEEEKNSKSGDNDAALKDIDLEEEDRIINDFIAIALGDQYDDIEDNNIEWTKHKTNDKDIKIDHAYIKKANIMTVRSSVTVPVSYLEFHDFVDAQKDGIFEAIKKCDDMCIEIGAVNRYDNDRCLVYSAYNAPVPKIIYPRDFCYLKSRRLCKQYNNTPHDLCVDVCYSVNDKFPGYVVLNKDRVRAQLFMAGLLFERLDDNLSRAYYIIQLDPKGWIPTWIVNLTAPQQGYNIKWVRDYLPKIQSGEDNKTVTEQNDDKDKDETKDDQ